MTVPINDENLGTGQEYDIIYQDEDTSNAGLDQCTDDEKWQKSTSTNTENIVVKQKTIKKNYAVLVTLISCVMAIVKTVQSEFTDIFEKHMDSHSLIHDHRNKMSWMTLKSKRDYYMPKCKAWLNRFVRSFHFYPKTFLRTYLLDPEEYNKFVDQQKSKQSSFLKESMQFEWCRLSSFASYPNTNISVIKLAKAGYYYTGNGDEVICYFCGSKHQHWKSTDDPKEIHKEKASECPFVIKHLSAISKQDHVWTISTNGGAESSASACGNAADAENLSVVSEKHCESVDEQPVHVARANHENTFTVGRNNENAATVDRHYEHIVTVDRNNEHIVPVDRNHEHIVTVDRNITSTRNSEPTENLVNNVFDRQRESSEAVLSQITTNQTQTMYSRNDTTGLIRIQDANVAQQRTLTPAVINSARSSASNSAPMNIGICLEKPKYPKYAIKTTRFSSFTNWPSYLSQTPEDLVNAGFFYTGTEDHCRCFFCGGGLRRWEEEDLPWTEHARWYPMCPFVVQCKGEKFIDDVQQGKNPEIAENVAEKKQKKASFEINGYINNPAVQTILDFGYESDVVKTAYTRLKESGIHGMYKFILF
ncbi:unnamed protein product [Mytilus coruscus]|uniref:BIRC7_8 n=1 Tax=Mytilus coruscus TaxID=42192 RepID=A0A6J8D702_MYTCO|nr:unnamed protein product [Mytilus coruscus]